MNNHENIVLNATELIAQSDSMKALREEYNAMFSQVSSVLNQMNDGWSENLANNFTGKIATAQKGFAKIVEMLECGEMVAKEAATSFEDINAVMARQISGGFASIFSEFDIQQAISHIHNIFDINNVLKPWEKMQENMPEGIMIFSDTNKPVDLSELVVPFENSLTKSMLHFVGPGGVLNKDQLKDAINQLANAESGVFGTDYINKAKDIYNGIEDVFNGKMTSDVIDGITSVVDMDTVSSVLGFTDGTALGLLTNSLKKFFGDGENLDSFSPSTIEFADHWQGVLDAYQSGDYIEAGVSGVFRALEGSTKLITESAIDMSVNTITSVTDFLGVTDIMNDSMQHINDVIESGTGIDIIEVLPQIGETISNGYDDVVTHVIDGTVNVIENITDGVAAVGDLFENATGFFGSLF